MENVRFLPWVGRYYSKGIAGKRIIVLGESHYCASVKDAIPELTINIIKDLFDPNSEHEGYKNTYTKFERALTGKPLSFAEKEEIWNSVLFYNYVQVPLSGARIAPTSEEFASSETAFFEILEEYQPDYLLVWGQRLYKNLPRHGYQLPDLQISAEEGFETWAYALSNCHTVQVLPIIHPSAAFVPEYWHKVIQAFIQREIR